MTQCAISVPNFGAFGDPDTLVDLAARAERAGWDAVFIWDHIQAGHWAGPVVDPWVTMAAMATATERLLLGPMVTPLPRRRPSKLARETATLDRLSGGRLILGVGIGWPPDADFARFGDAGDNKTRAEQLDEGLQVLTGLWTGEVFDHAGHHYTVENARFLPTPVQRPRIPIWVGGMWPHRPAFRRAARWDGVFPIAVDDDYDFTPLPPAVLGEIAAFTLRHRTSKQPFDIVVGGSLIDDPDPPARVAEYTEAGATWWVEYNPWQERPLTDFLDYIDAGPPAPSASCGPSRSGIAPGPGDGAPRPRHA